jgi:hypothetical protein
MIPLVRGEFFGEVAIKDSTRTPGEHVQRRQIDGYEASIPEEHETKSRRRPGR